MTPEAQKRAAALAQARERGDSIEDLGLNVRCLQWASTGPPTEPEGQAQRAPEGARLRDRRGQHGLEDPEGPDVEDDAGLATLDLVQGVNHRLRV